MKKALYQPPCAEWISFESERAMATDFSQIELPDHDWVKGRSIQVFPEGV